MNEVLGIAAAAIAPILGYAVTYVVGGRSIVLAWVCALAIFALVLNTDQRSSGQRIILLN